ncbi:oxidoreductase [Seleniivibrio woodruffii]|uniref:NAD(P)-dependent dehydrogenase (Short-subunit alcohol dehydrogenase family) n=1 Tax=Seleniivibrio woodruffii TaxID=1078050 RepID=A0A4R1KCW0_9BACT|nr:oxidoreductase [Seleniivibrio woodruffii]TCK62372.1 NAD(P)-dependent dehydrogenase (short-subunit alcohol dehydrogenase family) [Seleniivibrio woodruffii]TVZ34510.1 NAD(P)-dependent dehydrogenase (short-subunit alcohol dehydrogenase family) [Seleniivibrio woodruffii]
MLTNQVVVITGGAGLLGREFVKAVTAQNATAVMADMDTARAEAAAEGILNCDVQHLDITSKDSVSRLIETLHLKYGRVDAVVNSAYPRNKNYGRHFFDVDYDDFCHNMNLNLGGYFLVSQIFAEYFVRQGYGNIVNIASIYGVSAPKFEIYEGTKMTMPVEYSVIKSGLIHLTKYMAAYLKGKNIRVNSISPGGILDGQPEPFLEKYAENCLNKGMLDKTDISGTLVYLLSGMSRYVNGQNIVVDDGFSL